LPEWRALERRTGQHLFVQTGVLAFGPADSPFLDASQRALATRGIPHRWLAHDELTGRYPQLALQAGEAALHEPAAGVLLARRAVQALVSDAMRHGLSYRRCAVAAPVGEAGVASVATTDGEPLDAGRFVYACGPWLRTLFAAELGTHLRADRAEVYFLGVPPGDDRFGGSAFPAWMDVSDGAEAWGIPDVENRGFKLAVDKLVIPADPDRMNRQGTEEFLALVRRYVAQRFPVLANAPVVETRVCQYEMADGEEYLLDRHPRFDNVWWVGGGSGHGFKTGPAVGGYAAAVVRDGVPIDPRFRRARIG
jgi:glycine/D-amino acid oxidase-like deaminating enzyme